MTGSDDSETSTAPANNYNAVNVRLSHPALYQGALTFAFMFVLLGLNFLFLRLPFNGYDLPKTYIGTAFLVLGLPNIAFLTVLRNLKAVRIVMALQIGWTIIWASSTIVTVFDGSRTTFQLAILYGTLAFLEGYLLLEPFRNETTERKKE